MLALVITISTNLLLKSSSFMMGMSIGTIVLLTLAISAAAPFPAARKHVDGGTAQPLGNLSEFVHLSSSAAARQP